MVAKTTNISYYDTLRALATLGVIIIHIASPLVNMTYGKNMQFWWVGNLIDSGARFAVPVFLMLSGATLLAKECSFYEFYKKRFLRVFVPFIFWLLIYWGYRYLMLLPHQKPLDFSATINWAIQLFLKEGVSKHFWYIYMILFLYLFIPFINKALLHFRTKTLLYLILFWLLLTVIFKSTPFNLYGWANNFGSKILGFFLHAGYLFLGYYLSMYVKNSQKLKFSAITVFMLSILFCAIYSYYASKNAGKLNLSMYSYLSINTIIQTIAIFLWIKNIKFENKHVTWLQNAVSNYSYGIYLVHILIIGVLFRNGIYWNFTHPILSLPLLLVVVLICSFGIIYIIRKIPLGKYISG